MVLLGIRSNRERLFMYFASISFMYTVLIIITSQNKQSSTSVSSIIVICTNTTTKEETLPSKISQKQVKTLNFKFESQNSTSSPLCRPKTHIGFLKTHKCGSSTVQNILFRFGEKHSLNFILPKFGNILSKCTPFKKKYIKKVAWKHLQYDILANHLVWNTAEIKELLPRDSIYFTILRDPVDAFESMYKYYGLGVKSRFAISLDDLSKGKRNNKLHKRHLWECFGFNQMLYDFGVPNQKLYNQTFVQKKIKEADKLFHLVMIADYFDESLILLNRYLCWDLKDLTYLKVNSRTDQFKTKMTEEQRRNLRNLLQPDYNYYEHFLEKFKKAVKEYGEERMEKEVKQLRQLNEQVRSACVVGKETNLPKNFMGWKVQGYKVRNTPNCQIYAKNEFAYTDALRSMAMKKVRRKKH